jgi:hypothetical protein
VAHIEQILQLHDLGDEAEVVLERRLHLLRSHDSELGEVGAQLGCELHGG